MNDDPYALSTLWCRACQEASCSHLQALRGYLSSIKEREAVLSLRESEVRQAADFVMQLGKRWLAGPDGQ